MKFLKNWRKINRFLFQNKTIRRWVQYFNLNIHWISSLVSKANDLDDLSLAPVVGAAVALVPSLLLECWCCCDDPCWFLLLLLLCWRSSTLCDRCVLGESCVVLLRRAENWTVLLVLGMWLLWLTTSSSSSSSEKNASRAHITTRQRYKMAEKYPNAYNLTK